MSGLTEAKGASLILDDDLLSVANAKGASLIGVEDSGGNFTGTDVEAVLTELATVVVDTVIPILKGTLTKSANYTVVAGDRGYIINVTGTVTINLLAAATATDGFALVIRNAGTGVITVDGNASETVNGATTLVLQEAGWVILTCDGTNWSGPAYNPIYSEVVQVVHGRTGSFASGTTIIPLDDTVPQNTEGDEYIALAITPTDAANKLLIQVAIQCGSTYAVRSVIAALFQDSVASALAVSSFYVDTLGETHMLVFSHYMTAGAVAEITFKLRGGLNIGSGAAFTLNGTSATADFAAAYASSLTITELRV